MKTKHFLCMMAVVLVALLAGATPSWAWDHQDTFTDDGNEQCTFRYSGANMTYKNSSLGASDMRGFRTKVKFDNLNGTYYWEFHQRVCFKTVSAQGNDRKNSSVKGTMYIITDDDVAHKVCDYSKAAGGDKVVLTNLEQYYGRIIFSDMTSGGWLEVKLLPTDLLLKDGFKAVRFSNDRLMCSNGNSWGPFEYEKATGTNYTPMPEPTLSWHADGMVRAEVKDVPNGVDHPECLLQAYRFGIYRFNSNSASGETYLSAEAMILNDETITKKNGNRVDAAKSFTVPNEYAYALPLFFYVESRMEVKPFKDSFSEDWRLKGNTVVMEPYTHPTELTTTFDQWKQTVTVQWTYMENFSYYDEYNTKNTINCRTAGKWYLLRREKSKDGYTQIASFDRMQKRFSYTDQDCSVDKEYVYRVVFLPDVLADAYADKVADMPFSGLWTEKTMSTTPQVSIRLQQNRADEGGVALYWEHSIQDADAKFSVQRTTAGGTSWTTIARDIAVSVGQPYATYVDQDVSSPCEFYSYRVVAQTLGREFTSNIIEGNLPSGSRITAVDATKGSEERVVFVKWQVQQHGTEDTWFSIRRRILGSKDEWVEIGTAHGTDAEYTFTDERVMAGSYYEYAVVAYSKACGEEPTLSDMMTASGFSQARGTITGHVSFGTGTAVKDVRVNLVRTTDGNEEDLLQYLSRYIEGEGKGLSWKGDSARYTSVFNSGRPLTLQLWAQPTNGDSKMQLARLNNAIELGLRRTDDTTPFTYRYMQWGKETILGKGDMSNRRSSPGLNGSSEGGASLYDGDPSTKMCAKMEADGAFSMMVTRGTPYVSSYILTTAADAQQNPGRNPRSWRILASGGQSGWMTIATVTNDTRMEDKNGVSYEYPLDVPGRYQYFRFEVIETQGSDIFQLADMTYKSVTDELVEATITNVKVVGSPSAQAEENPYHLYAIDLAKPGYAVTEFPALTFSDRGFTHLTATYDASHWVFSVGADTLRTDTMVISNVWNALAASTTVGTATPASTLSFGGTNRLLGSAYKGYVDDVRLWNRKLTDKEIATNYTRMLGGAENGLMLYWPLDEGMQVKDYAFDVACQDGISMLNHPTVGVNAVPTNHVPDRLKLYGLTDEQGDYIIRGIPFQQGGTNYKVVPQLGIHQFNPNTRSMFVSPTSLTANNIDFEDVSSFPMSGHIHYAGTNIPAEGIQFYIDGDLVTGNGQVKTTDSDGYYTISVPIGEHYVEAKLDGHTMASGGRFPTQGTYNFERAVQYDFADSTLVNFVGRVSGGLGNDSLAVGFGASTNNIGKAIITLKLNNESFSFNCKDDHISDADADRTWQSDTTSIGSQAWTGTGTDAKYIYIRTDAKTGEFSALLPPLKYITKSIRMESRTLRQQHNDDIEFTDLPQIDLTSAKKEMKDSLKQVTETGDSVWNYYTYNTKMVRSHFATPQLLLWQKQGDGAFGEQMLKAYPVSTTDTIDINDIWTRLSDGTVKYTYGFPVFARKKQYVFGIRGFEVYTNYDSGKAVADSIPLNGQVLTIANEMSDEQDVVARVVDPSVTDLKAGDIYNLKRNQLRLDQDGRNEVTFTTGAPNITAPYTRQFSMAFERGNRNYVGPVVNGIVLGELTNGNNFITEGPDHVDMVLRDPPGAKGKTTWKSGTSYTTIDSKTLGGYFDETLSFDLIWGADAKVAVGVGVAIISSSKAETVVVAGEKSSSSVVWKNDKTYVYTTAQNVSTSTGSKYVGANGDIFIGKSHNFIIGTCRKLGFHREASGIVLGLKEAVSINDSIKTDFMYSALEIKETMLPKLEDTRNSFLEYMDSVQAENYVNTSEKDVYLTWLKPGDPNYGKEKTYVWKQGTEGKTQNMVLHYNESMRLWRERLRENEQDKIEAFKDPQYYKENRSFDGGTSYTYSERRDTTLAHTRQTSLKVGGIYEYKTQWSLNQGATFGSNFNFKTEIGFTGNRVEGDSLDNVKSYMELDYDLADGNAGTDFTVDIYHSPRGWGDIFLLRGGQSYNPYEGQEYAQYYEPEKKHVISYGTEQMEQPAIAISTDGVVGAKSTILTDVPAGQTGQFTLHLSNNNHTHQPMDMTYVLDIQEHTDTLGLEILMDGVPMNGRSVWIPAGETVKKVITVRQTDQSQLEYKGVKIRFRSQYQALKIYDEVSFDINFKPSSSPIDLVINDPVLNIETLGNNAGNLEMKVTNFDRQFKGMTKVGVEYRYEGSTTWAQPSELTFLVNRSDSVNADDQVLPASGDLYLNFNMNDDNSYPQGTYTFRAYTTTMYGKEPIRVYSKELTVVKDNVRPRNLFTPAPASGVLRYGDDIALEFNEDIVPGYVSDKNVIVTGKLNNQPVNHEVALQLIPYGTSCYTENPIFLDGDFSLEFWVKYSQGGFLLRQGKSFDLMAVSIDNDGRVGVHIGGNTSYSTARVPKDTWTYFAIGYRASDMTFTALAEYGTESVLLFDHVPVNFSTVSAINYSDDNRLYLGSGITASMHDLALYNIYRDVNEAGASKYVSKDQYVYGLTNYWPMNEGHGEVAADTRHTHNFVVYDRWELSNTNYCHKTNQENGLEADITRINTSQADSYAIELWHNSYANGATVFETGSNERNKIHLHYDADMNLVLDYGVNSQVVASHADFPNHSAWHHLALNVVRGQAASFYYNGNRTAVMAEADMPALKGAVMKVGTGTNGGVDELRIWHGTLTEERLLSNMYNCIDTTDIYSRGLVAYYPFEKLQTVNGVPTYVPTLEDMAPANTLTGHAISGDLEAMTIYGPPVKEAPRESRVVAKPVASDRKIVIRLEESSGIKARDLEGVMLNITVDKIHDMNGNESKPIRWTTYVQLNTLKWTRDSVNIIKQYGNDYTFDVNIENRGGNSEYYTLYNMPQWLTLVGSERTDDVAPQSTKTLRFSVNPLVPVGTYDVTIGLQGNNEILEPLRIVLTVQGQKPAWAVDPNGYENSMSIVGQVYINGMMMGNADSRVAAFIGNECRGIATPRQLRGAAFVVMNVYGTAQQNVNGVATDLDKGQPITFRVWDATTGTTYANVNITLPDKTVTDQFVFDPVESYGDFDHPILFTPSNRVEQSLAIRSGWNWLSLGVEPMSAKVTTVFKDLVSWNAQLKDHGNGVAYSRGSYWAGSLKEVHANTMYKLQLTRLQNSADLPQPFTVTGEHPKLAETPVTLEPGWNWMPYLPLVTMPVGEALAGLNPKVGDQVKSQTGFAYYGRNGWEGNLEALESGRGYLYHSLDTTKVKQFVYPTTTAVPARRTVRRAPLTVFSPVEPTSYPDNMAVVIQLTDGGTPVTDAEVAVYIEGECRAAATADDGLYYLLVAGEGSGQTMEIVASVGGNTTTVCNTLTYTSDGSIGTPWEPFVIDLRDASGISDVHVAMVPGVWYTLQGLRYGSDKPTAPGVYLYNGQKIVIK